MSRPIPAIQVAAIVAEVGKHADGATFLDVASALNPTPNLRNLQRWLAVLTENRHLVRIGNARATRYKLPPTWSPQEPASFASPAGQAIHRLVTQPLGERMPADYRRVTLEAYRPNETWYLSAERRAAARAVGPDSPADLPVTGARSSDDVSGGTSASRVGTAPDRALTALATCALWLENATDAIKPYAVGTGSRRSSVPGMSSATPLTDAEIVSWLAEPERSGVRWEAQVLWNIRTALTALVNRGPSVRVTPALLAELYQQVTARLNPGGASAATFQPGTGHPAAGWPSPLRRTVLDLRDTAYAPPADPRLIETCTDQVLDRAVRITDPLEQSFFLLTHLLYLLPFGTLNVTMALLTMNVPLVAAGLPLVTFAGVPPGDVLAGIRGVWELGRTDLLAEVRCAQSYGVNLKR